MLYKRQLAWTNGSGNTAYKVVSWAVGCQPETGWEEMNWKVMQKLTGSLWEPASQIGSEPKAPPLRGMAVPTTPSPLHIATGSMAMAPGACMLQVTCHWKFASLSCSNSRTNASDWSGQGHFLQDGCMGTWEVITWYFPLVWGNQVLLHTKTPKGREFPLPNIQKGRYDIESKKKKMDHIL